MFRSLGIPYEAALVFSLGEWADLVASGAAASVDRLLEIAAEQGIMASKVAVSIPSNVIKLAAMPMGQQGKGGAHPETGASSCKKGMTR